ncbi:hypothetical protein MTO96_040399 [Rhipicephalus appendiculatus]
MMILFTTTLLLLAGLSQQQSTEDLNAYVDKILKEELPAEKIDPPDHARLQLPHQGPPAHREREVPTLDHYRVYVGCNVTYGEIKVQVKSQLKYDRNSTTVTADTTFPEVHGRLYVSAGAWKGPKARAFPKLGNFTTTFTGLDENPQTQKLRWGYYEVIRDILAVSIERTLSWAISESAGKVLWPCC